MGLVSFVVVDCCCRDRGLRREVTATTATTTTTEGDWHLWFGGAAVDLESLVVKDCLFLFTCVVVVVVVVVGIGTPTGDDDSDMCSSDNDDYDGHATMAPVRR